MFSRDLAPPGQESFFVFGPRGTGKSTWVERTMPGAITFDLLELRATNDNFELGYDLSYWHTREHAEVDFVLYGERGLVAIEVKRGSHLQRRDFDGLRRFAEDYPSARRFLFYGGVKTQETDGVRVLPLSRALPELPELLAG